MRHYTKACLATTAFIALGINLSQAGELSMLTWEGYVDKSFTAEFTEKTGCKINAKYVGSGDEIATTMLTGRGESYDLFAVSSDLVPRFIDAGVVDEVDMSKVPNAAGFYPQFQNPDFAMRGGKQYALPYAFGIIRMAVDSDQVSVKPDSLGYLWDPAMKGKVALWDDLESLYMAGRYLGFKNIYDMSDDELAQARDALITLKPNIRKFWSSAGELTSLYQQRDIATSNAWDITLTQLIRDGRKMELVQPKEGLGGWIDSHMIVKGHASNECVHAWLDYASDPKVQAKAFKVTSYTFANASQIQNLDDSDKTLLKALGGTDAESLKNVSFWQPVRNRGKYLEIWNQVKSASSE